MVGEKNKFKKSFVSLRYLKFKTTKKVNYLPYLIGVKAPISYFIVSNYIIFFYLLLYMCGMRTKMHGFRMGLCEKRACVCGNRTARSVRRALRRLLGAN